MVQNVIKHEKEQATQPVGNASIAEVGPTIHDLFLINGDLHLEIFIRKDHDIEGDQHVVADLEALDDRVHKNMNLSHFIYSNF